MRMIKGRLTPWLGMVVLLASNLMPARSSAYILGGEKQASQFWQFIQGSGMDKLGHFSLFFLITSLFVISYPHLSRLALSTFFLVGIVLEFSQQLVEGRSFEWLDLIANMAGIALAVFWVKARVQGKADILQKEEV